MGHGFPVRDRFADGAQYIGGRLRAGTSGRHQNVVDPATGEMLRTLDVAAHAVGQKLHECRAIAPAAIASMTMTEVPGSCSQYSSRSFPLTSGLLPTETNWEIPIPYSWA